MVSRLTSYIEIDIKVYYKYILMEKSIIAGSIAGGIGYVSTLPLDFIKQHLQSDRNFNYQTIQKNGWGILFKGGLIGSASIIPQMVIKFTANDILHKKTRNSPFTNGFLAGYLDGSFLGPVLAVQSIQQMNYKYSYKDAFKKLCKSRHFLSLSIPMALRNGVYTSILFGGHQKCKGKSTFLNNLTISSILNIPAVIACSPFDVIRAKQIQYMLDGHSVGVREVTNHIYKQRGIGGFYQGFGSLYINFALRFPLTFALFYSMMDTWD